MEENSNNITPENSTEWLASCGFIFPRNEKELTRFDILYGGIDPMVTGEAVDPFRIIRNMSLAEKEAGVIPLQKRETRNKLVATQLKPLPPHILSKLGKTNPNEPKGDKPTKP